MFVMDSVFSALVMRPFIKADLSKSEAAKRCIPINTAHGTRVQLWAFVHHFYIQFITQMNCKVVVTDLSTIRLEKLDRQILSSSLLLNSWWRHLIMMNHRRVSSHVASGKRSSVKVRFQVTFKNNIQWNWKVISVRRRWFEVYDRTPRWRIQSICSLFSLLCSMDWSIPGGLCSCISSDKYEGC